MIKERIKDIEKCIYLIEMIRDNTDSIILKVASEFMIEEMIELKEIFILSVTYSEVS